MRLSTIMTYVVGVGLVVLGVTMAKTNPSQAEYEEYAVQQLTKYLKSDVCKKTPKVLENLIKLDCDKLVDSTSPQVRELVAGTTERQDFIIFSIYRTDLKLNSWLPSYTFESVGAFENFYTYNAEQH
ncbi:DUF4359 domain-containing protein [Scytonema hofmannii FACHB-248]|uniref:DUF4359 domain-containing protein n=1 Tax=Scytonema hofmannii FACHB-248 TaxID=1842502 RepID=A0ABR8GUK1_9CYAN|nr:MULTISPECIES: DUF4359 domain-containing protein [Nostocales]MBD2607187.1 DUF4359 domain-containing protein [Scytonema hofmannii FACHB-248]